MPPQSLLSPHLISPHTFDGPVYNGVTENTFTSVQLAGRADLFHTRSEQLSTLHEHSA